MVDETAGSKSLIGGKQDSRFVEVMFAKSTELAQGCRDFLLQHEIPARVEDDMQHHWRSGVAVLVQSDLFDEASELLVTRVQDDHDSDDNDELSDDGDSDIEVEDDGEEDDVFEDDDDF